MAAERPRPRELYRDPAHGKVAGICAGIARYFDWPVWPVRLVVALVAVFTQFFPMLAAYLIAWFILDPVSSNASAGLRGQVDGWVMQTRSRWEYGNSPIPAPMAEPDPKSAPPAEPPAPRAASAQASAAVVEEDNLSWLNPMDIEAAYAELEQRVQRLERHVTEPAFVLRQQFRSL